MYATPVDFYELLNTIYSLKVITKKVNVPIFTQMLNINSYGMASK